MADNRLNNITFVELDIQNKQLSVQHLFTKEKLVTAQFANEDYSDSNASGFEPSKELMVQTSTCTH
jgi:hypothetical protein